jgi:hypothetical protein
VEGISGTFHLGAIDVSEEDKEALSEYTLEDNSETLSVDVYAFLQELSNYDNYVKLVVNDYINNDLSSEYYYSTGISIQMGGSISDVIGGDAVDNVSVNHTELHLYSDDDTSNFNFVSPSGNENTAGNYGADSAVKWSYSVPAGGAIEEGYWQIEGDGEVVAEFYYALDIGCDDDGNALVPIPVITPTYDSDDKITSMSIEWRVKNSDSSTVIPTAILDELIDRSTFWIQSTTDQSTTTQMFDRDMSGDFNEITFDESFEVGTTLQIGFRFGSYSVEYYLQDPT